LICRGIEFDFDKFIKNYENTKDELEELAERKYGKS